MRSFRTTAPGYVVVAALVLAACSDSDGGTAEEAPRPDSGQASSATEPPASTSANPNSPLADVDPCSVLSTAKVQEFGPVEASSPEKSEIGGAPACTWHGESGHSTKPVASTSVVIRTDGGVDTMPNRGSGVQQTEEDGRRFARSPGPDVCTIAIGVTDSTRVDIGVSGVETDEACEIANGLVEAAVPNVPQG